MCARALRLWDFAFALPGPVPGKPGFCEDHISISAARLRESRPARGENAEARVRKDFESNRFKREGKASHGFLTEKVFAAQEVWECHCRKWLGRSVMNM
jgi:hypothetical protein